MVTWKVKMVTHDDHDDHDHDDYFYDLDTIARDVMAHDPIGGSHIRLYTLV